MSPIVLWSDGSDPEHRAELLKTAAGIRLRIARLDIDGRRVSHYVALSSEECDGLARALAHREEAA